MAVAGQLRCSVVGVGSSYQGDQRERDSDNLYRQPSYHMSAAAAAAGARRLPRAAPRDQLAFAVAGPLACKGSRAVVVVGAVRGAFEVSRGQDSAKCLLSRLVLVGQVVGCLSGILAGW